MNTMLFVNVPVYNLHIYKKHEIKATFRLLDGSLSQYWKISWQKMYVFDSWLITKKN